MEKAIRFILFLLLAQSGAAQVSRFDNDTEQWGANFDAVGHIVHFDPTRGNPPPSIYAIDADTGLPWYFVAPSCFLGNRAYAYGDSLKYELFTPDAAPNSYTDDIIIIGQNGMTLVHNNGYDPTDNVWTKFGTRLLESEWHIGDGGGPNPSQAEFLAVLSDIRRIEIRGEYRHGDDRSWIDNVWMGEVPDTLITARICAGEVFQVGKYAHSTTGTFLDELEDQSGCDSLLVLLDLTVLSAPFELRNWEMCTGEKLLLPDGSETDTSGIFPFVFSGANGCDSTIVYSVKVWAPTEKDISTAICRGETYTLPNGATTQNPGSFTFNFQTVHGCDSIVRVALAVFDTAWSASSAIICGGESWPMPDGSYRSLPGVYEFNLQTKNGCDSTVLVNLSVTDSSLTRIRAERCPGDWVRLPDGKWADTSGIYTFAWQNQWGCDSTWVFDVHFFPVADTLIEVVLEQGERYVLPNGDVVRDTSIDKVYHFATTHGCDSTVALRLDYILYKVFIPNVITPNNDGENDFFTIFTNEDAREVRALNIYDRWGNHVFQNQHFQPNQEPLGWDGSFRGKSVEPGVFTFWTELEFVSGRVFFFSGDVTVLR